MKSIISIIMAVGQFIMSIFAIPNSVTPSVDTSDFSPIIRFEVFSDSHIKNFADSNSMKMQKVISLAYADADGDESYNNLDAIMIAGDITNDGKRYQFRAVKETLDSVVRQGTDVMGVVHSSHDCKTYKRDGRTFAEKYLETENDFHKVINGFHFIGVSVCDDESIDYSQAQYDWMKAQLDEAVKDDPAKPIFVMHHEHVYDTVYGSRPEDGWGQKFFKDLFSQYPQIVHFSGHSHYPINDPRSIWQGEFSAVGTGALYYVEHTVDGHNVIQPKNREEMAQCWIVEVDKNNSVRLRGFDALSGQLLVEYTLNDIANAENRQYSPSGIKAESSAPVFSEGSKIKLTKLFGKYIVTAPAAKSTDGKIIFLYRVYVISPSGEIKHTEYLLNNYQVADTFSKVKFKVNASEGDEIRIVAENAYGMQSEPISAIVTDMFLPT